MGRLKRIFLPLSINAILLTLLIYGFELFLRWRDPKRLMPPNGFVNGQMITWGHPVVKNRFGFRERDFETPKPQSVFRIMVLGDSLTWGAGLAPEERYSYLLEKQLNERYPGKKFEVLNFGISGLPTTLERSILGAYKDIVPPDLIIVGFCVNDPQPRSENYSIEREQFETRYSRLFNSISYRSQQLRLVAFGDLVAAAIRGFAEKTNGVPQTDVALSRVYVETSPEWNDFLTALKDIKRMSDEMQLPPPVFAALNQSARLGSDYDHPNQFLINVNQLIHKAEHAAKDVGFTTFDYEREIPRELPNDATAINSLDGHPSAKLNALYAKKLFEALVNELHLNNANSSVQVSDARSSER